VSEPETKKIDKFGWKKGEKLEPVTPKKKAPPRKKPKK
jgi:hypothetical protein